MRFRDPTDTKLGWQCRQELTEADDSPDTKDSSKAGKDLTEDGEDKIKNE